MSLLELLFPKMHLTRELRRVARLVRKHDLGSTGLKYMYVPGPHEYPGRDGACSDRRCPCPGTEIPRGQGYLYISPSIDKVYELFLSQNKFMNTPIIMEAPAILMCEEGARKRNLDLSTAAADARLWWKCGLVPVRPTPHRKTLTP
jgi:hypothetical protein